MVSLVEYSNNSFKAARSRFSTAKWSEVRPDLPSVVEVGVPRKRRVCRGVSGEGGVEVGEWVGLEGV